MFQDASRCPYNDVLLYMLGTTLGGRYQIFRYLGGGGFGRTYLAHDQHLPGTPACVVKQLKPRINHPGSYDMACRLFNREAEVLYLLGEHDQIPRLFAHFEEQQEFYLVQEFVDGQVLNRALRTGHCLDETAIIELLKDLLSVLIFVHEQQVIHRDIKPSNLIRRKHDGALVMIDFGGVKQLRGGRGAEPTMTMGIGSAGYMPNEQLAGRPRYSSDIYAVGMVAIRAVTGCSPTKLPESVRTGEVCWRDRAPYISEPFARVIDRMIRYDFRERYTTASEALAALKFLDSEAMDIDSVPSNVIMHPSNPMIRHLKVAPKPSLHSHWPNAFPAPTHPTDVPDTILDLPHQPEILDPFSELTSSSELSDTAPESSDLFYTSPDLSLLSDVRTIGNRISQCMTDGMTDITEKGMIRHDFIDENRVSRPVTDDDGMPLNRMTNDTVSNNVVRHARVNKDGLDNNIIGHAVIGRNAASREAVSHNATGLLAHDINDPHRDSHSVESHHAARHSEDDCNPANVSYRDQPVPPSVMLKRRRSQQTETAITEPVRTVVPYTRTPIDSPTPAPSSEDSQPSSAPSLPQHELERWRNLGDQCFQDQDYERSIACYTPLLSSYPEDYLLWFKQAMAMEYLQRHEEAIACYKTVLTLQPQDYLAWSKLGKALETLERYDQAVDAYTQVLQIQPQNYWAWHDQGRALEASQHIETAIASYDRAIQLKPDFQLAIDSRKRLLAQLNQVERLYRLQHYDEALQSCLQTVETNPEDPLAWLMQGMTLENALQYKAAIQAYDQVLQLEPTDHVAWFRRGGVQEKVGNYEEAARSYRQVTQLQEQNHWAWNDLGRILETLHRYRPALHAYDRAIELQPSLQPSIEGRDRVLRQLKRTEPTPKPLIQSTAAMG